MIIGLLIILILTLILPFSSKIIEHNLEVFLFVMGLLSVIISRELSNDMLKHIINNNFLYMITGAVLVVGIVFKMLKKHIKGLVENMLKHISLELFVFFIILVLGLISSIITAIIASLLLVEIVFVLPLDRATKIKINIVTCFSIGLGAALTPLGEPISTIVVSKLNADFGFIFEQIGSLAIAGIVLLGLLGVLMVKRYEMKNKGVHLLSKDANKKLSAEEVTIEEESYKGIFIRTIKIFVFIIALELLGKGFKPIIDRYVINLDSSLLYFGNMVSAVLDNATLAAAEISPKMNSFQIKSILMGLLISGGMLIPGNIPNIITAGKLKIKSSEWAKLGVPIGLSMMLFYYIILFLV